MLSRKFAGTNSRVPAPVAGIQIWFAKTEPAEIKTFST
jgi:hypothetical protein